MEESFKESNYYKHAISEFKYAGYKPIDEEEDGPNKWIQENILELLELFDKQGHSGSSATYCIGMFSKLASFKPISGIMCTHSEFQEVWNSCFQNKRLSSVFKESETARPYYLEAIVWKEKSGSCFTGRVEDISSRQYIKSFPFVPKTFYIDVESWEVDKETNEPSPGSGWWESRVVDRRQLSEVFEYYDVFRANS